jgi:hypothetical protein
MPTASKVAWMRFFRLVRWRTRVQPQAGPLPLGAHPGVGSHSSGTRSRRDSSGEHAGVDPVGLTRQRRQPLDLGRIRDRDLEAGQLELVGDKPGAVHRLDRCVYRPAAAGDLAGKPTQPIHIGWCLDDLDGGAVGSSRHTVQTTP